MMNTTIWIIQGLLGVSFTISGLTALLLPKGKLLEKMPWSNDFSSTNIKLIGFAKLIGGIGIILPSLILNRWSLLTTVSAIGLALIMICAVFYHISKKETKEIIPPSVFFLMAVFVVYQFVIRYYIS